MTPNGSHPIFHPDLVTVMSPQKPHELVPHVQPLSLLRSQFAKKRKSVVRLALTKGE
jgi:hypothetical protein